MYPITQFCESRCASAFEGDSHFHGFNFGFMKLPHFGFINKVEAYNYAVLFAVMAIHLNG
ncbi:hypothetical protein BJI67_11695 [Acidihalobacter aeolianus]|uniref:Uncharacterized protein n=1 Tax=Acidihalobacter aeolianus TaxID=2792603 RepID=A0A1D8K9I9_9GAMM|nr:hypothetical protein BJI67_11695 [Acidihalobacter aeolianus]